VAVTTQDLLCRSDNRNHFSAGDAVEDLTPYGLAFNQAAVLQAGQVPRHVRLAHANRLHEVGDPMLASGELKHNGEPGGITESPEHRRQQLGFSSNGHFDILSSAKTDVIGYGRSIKADCEPVVRSTGPWSPVQGFVSIMVLVGPLPPESDVATATPSE
jgi:hypothetical protein